ncbi:phosphonate ABC transporter ATP-binding protein [Flavobacteriaceae bacterium MHTCC 0001]
MIEVKNITKSTKEGRQILKGISFKANKGDFIGILGPSGAGKTLTMRCLNGLTKPTTGEILININGEEHDIAKYKGKQLRKLRQKIGVVFQGFNLVKRLSVVENVMIGKLGQINQFRSLFKGFNDAEAQTALEALDKVKIEQLAGRKVGSLSGGEMQRVAIARAIFQKPVILLADEPIANLDPSNAKKVMKRLKPLSQEMPVIGVFHQPEIAAKYCNRIIALKDGKIFYDGNSDISESMLEDIYGDELQEIENQAKELIPSFT